MYYRVIPRDLFNESKLLKCLGQLSLIAHDELDDNRRRLPEEFTIEHDGEAFEIEQRPQDGGLECMTFRAYFRSWQVVLYSEYNSKEPYPLRAEFFDETAHVFDDDGTLSYEFLELFNTKAEVTL